MIEVTGILVLGFLAQWLAWRIKVPAILPLILTGLAVGPLSTLVMPDHQKFIDGDKIFHGDLLFDVVSLSVGLILFEGGLTLKMKEVRNVATTVRNLIIFGTIITLVGGGIATHWIMGFSNKIAYLFGALIIVTGPTVIGPLLQNVKPNNTITTILKWEGILIDPIGALVAILIYDFIISGMPGEQFTLFALKGFMATVAVGLAVGSLLAWVIYIVLKKDMVPPYLRNTVVLGLVILSFSVSELVHPESGLLAVTASGMILGNLRIEQLKNVLSFKEDVSVILISFLFVMLSSRINMSDLEMLLDSRSLALFLIIVGVLRPLVVMLSTYGSGLAWKEKFFIGYICPRGIVAAGVASIFSVKLSQAPIHAITPTEAAEASMLLPLTFMTIVGTVVLQGLTAKPLANLLKLGRTQPSGVLFLGANEVARFMAHYLKEQGISVMLADTSVYNIREARNMQLTVYEGSLLDDNALEEIDFSEFGQLYATTSNNDINHLATKIIGKEIGERHAFRLVSDRELKSKSYQPKNLLFYGMHDFIGVTQIIRKKKELKQMPIDSLEELETLLQGQTDILPFFILKPTKYVVPVTQILEDIGEGDQLVYISLA